MSRVELSGEVGLAIESQQVLEMMRRQDERIQGLIGQLRDLKDFNGMLTITVLKRLAELELKGAPPSPPPAEASGHVG